MRIPLIETLVQAGFPSPAEDHVERSLDLNEHLIVHPAATFFIRVQGDSMKDAGILSGDLLIVDRALTPADGKIAIVIVNGEFTVKRLKMRKGKLYLIAENPSFPVLEVSPEAHVEIWGIVTYVIHKL